MAHRPLRETIAQLLMKVRGRSTPARRWLGLQGGHCAGRCSISDWIGSPPCKLEPSTREACRRVQKSAGKSKCGLTDVLMQQTHPQHVAAWHLSSQRCSESKIWPLGRKRWMYNWPRTRLELFGPSSRQLPM
mmetsp:Transcript_104576/g.263277  ORF Transcript_104576/g.263277 Transcript_104576/m.263277 type:complete len:132 (+) Transcript_104576:623-1018(+)